VKFDREKFKSVVHYICKMYAMDPSKLGKTKLHKILWLSDIWHYRQYGTPITGARYIKMQFGPFAEALDGTLKKLESDGKLYMPPIEEERYKKFDLIGKGEPDMSDFSKTEMLLINEVAQYVAENHTAASISDKTHDEIWRMSIMREEIPYEAMIAVPAKITDEHIQWAKSEIAKAKQ
jgi:hypothetical protein